MPDITLDRDKAEEILHMAIVNAEFCKRILVHGANANYIIINEFSPSFEYIRDTLMPLVFPDGQSK